ncbi:hypothetical protein H2O73_01495 [Vibrio sp. 404]|uniref:Uncharacterized protein n=1 Tax=Vibrio marinisediminis TaxID=2758441 RepID=A0A7W2FMT8_9VIBR|nr:hypothetical protein [Vibrio marinisediminis]MBA5761000.1 hypothetical protein [Vibrio marinisediminis]
MAVGSRKTDSNARYDPSQDFTPDQLRRFGNVANRAERDREQRERQQKLYSPDLIESAKRNALKPVVKAKNDKEVKSLRYAVWLSVALVFLLWLMYMTG